MNEIITIWSEIIGGIQINGGMSLRSHQGFHLLRSSRRSGLVDDGKTCGADGKTCGADEHFPTQAVRECNEIVLEDTLRRALHKSWKRYTGMSYTRMSSTNV